MPRQFIPKRMFKIVTTGALLTIANLQAANAAYCYSGRPGVPASALVRADGTGVLKKNAQKRARDAWNRRAQSLMGSSRANWGNAQGRSYHCDRGIIWLCIAYARPCM